MPSEPSGPSLPRALARDGTSQRGRRPDALDPASAPLDTRTLAQLLTYVAELGKLLRWYDEQNRANGTWDRLVGADCTTAEGKAILQRLADLADNPASVPKALAAAPTQPHVVLLLAALRLMGLARARLNGLPARHLDFYQREVLQLRPRPAEPDRVHVVATPAAGQTLARLPQGSLLAAGQDRGGQEQVYATLHDLTLSQARVAELRSLCAEMRVTDPAAVRRDTEHTPGEKFMDLLRLALGDPAPGDALPPASLTPDATATLTIDESFVTNTLATWLGFACAAPPYPINGLYLNFWELRELVALKRQRDNDADDWAFIDACLNTIGQRRDSRFDLKTARGKDFDPRAFAVNLNAALGVDPNKPLDLSAIPGVKTIDDLYDLNDRVEVRAAVENDTTLQLLLSEDRTSRPRKFANDFMSMMQHKRRIDRQWERINLWLERAGRRRDPSFSFGNYIDFAPVDFSKNLARALPDLDCSSSALPRIGAMALAKNDIAGYLSVIDRIECYFYMPAESLRLLIEQAWPALLDPNKEAPGLWRRTDAILAAARAAKAIEQRRAALSMRRKEAIAQKDDGLKALLATALDRPPGDPNLVEDALALLTSPEDRDLLFNAHQTPPTSDEGWKPLESLAERIWRTRLGAAAAPPPAKREWIALHPNADAAAAVPARPDGRSAPPESGSPWRTFGSAPDTEEQDQPPDPVLGWALTSPVLALRQGRRRIELCLQFSADAKALTEVQKAAVQGLIDQHPFIVEVSTADGWVAVDEAILPLTDQEPALNCKEPPKAEGKRRGEGAPLTLHIALSFPPSAPPIAAAPGLGIASPWPALRLMLRPRWDGQIKRFRSDYQVLRVLQLAGLKCQVTVGDPPETASPDPESGLTEPLLGNDRGLLDPRKAFEPFGPRPAVGSRLAIADPELAVKRLDRLWLDCVWLGVPTKNMGDWYAGYSGLTGCSNATFAVQAALVDRCSAYLIGTDKGHTDPVAIFNAGDATQPCRILLGDLNAALPGVPPPLDPAPPTDPTRWPRYLRLELTPVDFQDAVYPAEAAKCAQDIATWWARTPHPEGDPPKPLNPPIAPQIKKLGIGYSATTCWSVADGKGLRPGDALFHIHPFGTGRPQADTDGTLPFLPAYDALGALYIGVEGVAAPQPLSLLFQLAAGSADPDLTPPPVRWGYLDGDHWIDLDHSQVRRDDTRGLIQSGAVELDLPPAAPPLLLPAGRYWLRLAVDADPRGLCDTVAILANAVAAQFLDRGNDPAHYSAPLPAGSITGPVHPIPGLDTLSQPYSSFGGRPAESPAALATRAAERLRHRRRALTAWDYERLALERFPSLYKVKCLPAEPGDDDADLGLVQVIAIPDLRGRMPCDPAGPKAPADLIAEIADDLQSLAATGARVEVRNADFLPIRVRVGIRFADGCNIALARAQAIDGLNRALSPWAFDAQADLVIGGAIYSNSLVEILERHPSVRYVRTIHLFSFDAAQRRFVLVPPPDADATDGYRIAAQTSRQVLVSAGDHDIDVISHDVDPDQPWQGIGYMKIELDFKIA